MHFLYLETEIFKMVALESLIGHRLRIVTIEEGIQKIVYISLKRNRLLLVQNSLLVFA
jgi:hypothetical protein